MRGHLCLRVPPPWEEGVGLGELGLQALPLYSGLRSSWELLLQEEWRMGRVEQGLDSHTPLQLEGAR